MPKVKITERAITRMEAPDPSGKQTLHWNSDLRGFAVLCSGKSNAKTFIVQRDLPDGRARRVTIGAVNEISLEEARTRAADTLDALRRGVDPKFKAPPELTVQAALDNFLQLKKGLRASTAASYRRAVERYLASWLQRPLRSISAAEVEARHTAIAEETAKRYRARANDPKRTTVSGGASANMSMRVFAIIWNSTAKRITDLGPNPVQLSKNEWYAEDRREGRVTADQMAAFYQATQGLSNTIARDYILLLLFTGMRRREAASLEWSDVDFTAHEITIPASRTKGKRPLVVPMSTFVFDLLKSREKPGKEKFVFPANSKSGHIEEPRFALEQIGKACGITVSVHDLRRTFLTEAEASNVSTMVLKALVNHSTKGDVTAGYIFPGKSRLRESAQNVCDHLKTLCGIAPQSNREAQDAESIEEKV